MGQQLDGGRYKYDMAQAQMMSSAAGARQRRSPQGQQQQQQPASSGDSIGGYDVNAGLRGLDEAEELERNLQTSDQALKLYELSIEMLLKCLRQPSCPVNRDVISQRIAVALSRAEELKKRVSQNPRRPNLTERRQPASMRSLTASLSSAMSNSSPKPSPTNNNGTSPRNHHDPYPINGRTNSAPSSSSKKSKPQPAASAQPPARRSKLDYNKDPLVQVVKKDLYIDPSEIQNTTWNDIAGLARAKQMLQESAILPLLRPDLFQGLRKPQNILLYGPPGTGKTMLVKAVAHESKCLLFACSPSTLTSKWHGEGEKLIRTLFKVAQDAAPSLIFVDEMDSLLSSRSDNEHEASRRFKTEFMVQMDGVTPGTNNVLVVGCTNCPWNVDDAILRRFPRRIPIPLPDPDARKELLRKLLAKAGKHSLTVRQAATLVNRLDGFSGSDITSIASEASFGPLRSLGGLEAIQNAREDQLRPISLADFEGAVARATKSVSPSLLRRYVEWERQQAAK